MQFKNNALGAATARAAHLSAPNYLLATGPVMCNECLYILMSLLRHKPNLESRLLRHLSAVTYYVVIIALF